MRLTAAIGGAACSSISLAAIPSAPELSLAREYLSASFSLGVVAVVLPIAAELQERYSPHKSKGDGDDGEGDWRRKGGWEPPLKPLPSGPSFDMTPDWVKDVEDFANSQQPAGV